MGCFLGAILGAIAAVVTWFLVVLIPYLILSPIYGKGFGTVTDQVSALCVLIFGPLLGLVVGGVLWGKVCESINNQTEALKNQKLAQKLRKCPSCGSQNTEGIDRQTRYYNTTRTETRRHTHYDTDGNETGYTESEYEVPDTDSVTTYTRKCKSCNHVWTY